MKSIQRYRISYVYVWVRRCVKSFTVCEIQLADGARGSSNPRGSPSTSKATQISAFPHQIFPTLLLVTYCSRKKNGWFFPHKKYIYSTILNVNGCEKKTEFASSGFKGILTEQLRCSRESEWKIHWDFLHKLTKMNVYIYELPNEILKSQFVTVRTSYLPNHKSHDSVWVISIGGDQPDNL